MPSSKAEYTSSVIKIKAFLLLLFTQLNKPTTGIKYIRIRLHGDGNFYFILHCIFGTQKNAWPIDSKNKTCLKGMNGSAE